MGLLVGYLIGRHLHKSEDEKKYEKPNKEEISYLDKELLSDLKPLKTEYQANNCSELYTHDEAKCLEIRTQIQALIGWYLL